jgi:hypothetical protein
VITDFDELDYKPYSTHTVADLTVTDVCGAVYDLLQSYREQRTNFEANVLENWRVYLSDAMLDSASAYTETELRTQAMLNPHTLTSEIPQSVARNNVNSGKATEIVEAASAYLADALMPTDEWFEYTSKSPDSEANAELLTWYLRAKNPEWKFRLHVSQHIRQACIAGVSVFALPYYDNRVNYQVLDVLNCYWDLEEPDTERSPFIKRSMLTSGQVLDYVDSGYFSDVTHLDLGVGYGTGEDWIHGTDKYVQQLRGLPDTVRLLNKVACYEFWGTLPVRGRGELRNVIATVVNGKLVRLEAMSYPTRPYIITPYLPIMGTSYGIGCLQQIRGQAVAGDKLLNGLLDGVDARNLGMYTLLEDEVLRDDELIMAPGQVLRVRNPNALQRLPSPDVDVNSSLVGLQTLSEICSRVSGVSSIISAGFARQSERTTATEVREAQNAAGVRMLEVYRVFESAFVLPYLYKMADILRAYTDIRREPLVNIRKSGASYWVKMKNGAFEFDSTVAVYGAEHHERRQKKLDALLQFMQVSASVPQFAESIAWPNMLKHLVKLMDLPDDVVTEAPQTPPSEPVAQPTAAQGAETLENDMAMQNMLAANEMADGGASLAASTFGIDETQIKEMLQDGTIE